MATPQETNPLLSDPNFQELVSAVTSADGIMDSSAALMNGLAAKIEAGAAAGDTTALRALAQQLRDHAGIAGAAIEANSGLVAAPAPIAPPAVETPAPDAPPAVEIPAPATPAAPTDNPAAEAPAPDAAASTQSGEGVVQP